MSTRRAALVGALLLAACGPRAPAKPAPLAPANVLDTQPKAEPVAEDGAAGEPADPAALSTEPTAAGELHISGTIEVSAALARGLAPGVMFVSARAADGDGKPTGIPFAVAKVMYEGHAATFELTRNDAMINVTEVPAEAIISVRYDQDGDAITKQPGDLLGQARTVVPAANVRVALDQRMP